MTTKLKPKSCGCYSCRHGASKGWTHAHEQRAHRAKQRSVLKEAVKTPADGKVDTEELDIDLEIAYHGTYTD